MWMSASILMMRASFMGTVSALMKGTGRPLFPVFQLFHELAGSLNVNLKKHQCVWKMGIADKALFKSLTLPGVWYPGKARLTRDKIAHGVPLTTRNAQPGYQLTEALMDGAEGILKPALIDHGLIEQIKEQGGQKNRDGKFLTACAAAVHGCEAREQAGMIIRIDLRQPVREDLKFL